MENIKKRSTTVISLHRGFTLIELLVVISIIALLLSIMLPALGRARGIARRMACISNTRQLNMAWNLYAQDNRDRIVRGSVSPLQLDQDPANPSWVRYVDISAAADDNEAERMQIEGIRNGALYRYVSTHDVYRCPAANNYQKANLWRTYNISGSLNGRVASEAGKVIQLSRLPRPSERMTFVDMDDTMPARHTTYGRTFSTGYLTLRWEKKPGRLHQGGVPIGFVDGSASFNQWQNRQTQRFVGMDHETWIREDNMGRLNSTIGGNEDNAMIYRFVWGRPIY